MSFIFTLPVMLNVVSAVCALAVVAQLCRMGVALRNGNTRRLRWLILSVCSLLLLWPGALLMPATPAAVFMSVAGALKTTLCFILLMGGCWLTFLTSEAVNALPKADRG